MRVLLDEDVPVQVIEVLRHVLPSHRVTHVLELGWSGKPDPNLFRDVKGKFDVVVTNNRKQLQDPGETTAIKKSGVHHVLYRHEREGLKGLALAIAAIIAALPPMIEELQAAGGQRLVQITDIDPRRRYEITDPRHDPPRYWPR